MKCDTTNLAVPPQKWRTHILSWKEQWGLCFLFSLFSVRGELGTNLESETLVVRNQTETQVFYTRDIFLSQRGCSWVWPGVMESKSSLNSPMEPLDSEKKCYSHSVQLGFASSACLLSQYSPTSALRKYPKMHSRPSVCTERWFIQLCGWGLLSLRLCSVAAAGIWGVQFLCSPSHPTGSCPGLMIPVKWSPCWDSFTDVTKEINPVALVCPSFCFLWKVKWKWNNQTWIPSQNPDFPGKLWFSCLSSTLNDVFFFLFLDEIVEGWVEFLLGSCCLFCPISVTPAGRGLTHELPLCSHFIQWLFNKTQKYMNRAGIAQERKCHVPFSHFHTWTSLQWHWHEHGKIWTLPQEQCRMKWMLFCEP